MPNVTVFIRSDSMPDADALQDFSDRCTALCTGILKAALDKVHVVFVPVLHGRGHPAYVEVKYRTEDFRTREVMDDFMREVDLAMDRTTSLTARIRCFGYGPDHIHAKH